MKPSKLTMSSCIIALIMILCASCSLTIRKTVTAKCYNISDEYPDDYNPSNDSLPYSRTLYFHFMLYNDSKKSLLLPINNKGLIDTSSVAIKVCYGKKEVVPFCSFGLKSKGNVVNPGDSAWIFIRLYAVPLRRLGLYNAPLDTIIKKIKLQYVRTISSNNAPDIEFLIDSQNVKRYYRSRSEEKSNCD